MTAEQKNMSFHSYSWCVGRSEKQSAMCYISAEFSCRAALLLLMFIFCTHSADSCSFCSRNMCSGFWSTSSRCEREAVCVPWFKCVTYERQSYDKTDAYGFRKLFLPRYSLSECVCVCACVCVSVCGGVGGGWELVYSSHTLLWVLSTGEERQLTRTWQSESAAQ